jgi:hypothetical protein
MTNTEQYIITCRFAGWSVLDEDYGPFGVKYLMEMPIQPIPDSDDSDERWEGYDPHVAVLERFHEMFEHTIGKPFDGEIPFI